MKISVITAAYNSSATIGYAVESFLAQTHSDSELVIIDGGSQDKTLDILAGFRSERIHVWSEPDKGIFDAMNKGLDCFCGEVTGFLNSDDRLHDREVLEDIADALENSDIAFGNIDFVKDHASNHVVRRWRGSAYRRGAFSRGWMPPHPSFYVRRAVVDAVGRFDLHYPVAADYDWMLRAFELNDFRTAFLDRTFVNMQTGGNSTWGLSAYLRGNIESLKARRRHIGAGFVDVALVAKPVRKVMQYVRR